MVREIHQSFTVSYSFPVLFTRNVFDPENLALRDTLRRAGEKRHRALLVVDSNLAAADPTLSARSAAWAAAHADVLELVAPPFVIRGGEICKSDPIEVHAIHELVAQHRIDRQSFIIAIGGGAVLDATGYAAATAHRGCRLIRMPSTVLAQNDAGIGVKNGVNAFGRKNFIGSFAPPFAVINDFDLLATLSPRDRRAGIAEAVKVAAIKDAEFLSWLHRERFALAGFAPEATEQMIVRCAERHIEHIASADPFELGSARPLDFGHWTAHKLEELTAGDERTLRHGEAVAIGCALDSVYASRIGLLSEFELGKLLHTLEDIGFELYHPALDRMDLEEALGQFREHLGGALSVTLPDGLGRKLEVHEVDFGLMKRSIAVLAQRHAERPHPQEHPQKHSEEHRNDEAVVPHVSTGSA